MKPTLALLVPVLLVLSLARPAVAQGCLDCHAQKEGNVAKDPKAPMVSISKSAVHAEIECEECHAGVTTPHPADMKPVQCKACHGDEVKDVRGASHGKKLESHLKSKGQEKPSAVCFACHGHAHGVVKDGTASRTSRSKVSFTCLGCHREVQPIAVEKYLDSVHAIAVKNGKTEAAVCTDCHGSHAIDHSGLPQSKVNHSQIPQTCSQCHPDQYAAYSASAHWMAVKKGFSEAPVCTDCHGEHGILSEKDPQSATFAGNVSKTCASCHASERLVAKFSLPADRIESFKGSFHGLSGELGDVRVANCASCHGNHQILPSSDPRSSVHPANLSKTCGRCHSGAEKALIGTPIHTTEQRQSHWLVGMVRQLYLVLIAVVIGGMLLHNLLDLVAKTRGRHLYHKQEALEPRFSGHERLQHAALALSFIVLAISGFALKLPDSLFAAPFRWLAAGADVRRLTHRISAAVFLALSIHHVFYLVVSGRGRRQLRELLPRLKDVRDANTVVRGYLGRRSPPVTIAHYGYTEKLEYWALVWGAVVMTVTGLLLYFNNLTIARFPLWVADLATTIHYWEAVLASLAIIIWHGYWVMFDPEIYPMSLTWLIGRPRPEPKPHAEPDESAPRE